ncbi:MAG: hypothetical protein CME62_02475 [Halobacteriovoraceae bacterium]|nr:hypothetical protein [Halobacteriovoraceae bacterium]
MDRPQYLDNYKFNWETFDILAGGVSSIDAKNYLAYFNTKDDAHKFLKGYGYDLGNPIQNAEMFGNFQEALQFIKRYFLKEGNPTGLDLKIPNIFYTVTDVSELLLITNGAIGYKVTKEESLWASIILKVMHTILHLDKDIRYRYFTIIQTQIFDRFYRYIHREGEELYVENEDKSMRIPLVEFETKSKKSRESTIIKLLHKKENVAEELFDRIGVRFVTHTKVDCLRLMNFLYQNYIIMVNNIKPSRSQNSLIDLDSFRMGYYPLLKRSIREKMSEEEFKAAAEELALKCNLHEYKNNEHTSDDYSAIHFTCRQLIHYKNPFYAQFSEMRKFAKQTDPDHEITKKLLSIDTGAIAKDIRFFYPYEIQITDEVSHMENTKGDASHEEYKKSQLNSAMVRLFKPLIEHLNFKLGPV